MVAQGDGACRGKVHVPDPYQAYNSHRQLDRNSLSVEDRALGICRGGGTWQRADRAPRWPTESRG